MFNIEHTRIINKVMPSRVQMTLTLIPIPMRLSLVRCCSMLR